MKRYYKTANSYFHERFGCKVYKLALDGGMSCPNRDGTLGTRGCIFCSNGGSGDFAEKQCGNIKLQMERAIQRLDGKNRGEHFIAYFQSYTNTYADIQTLRNLFYSAISEDFIVGLSIATRPDCLGKDVLDLIAELNSIKPVFIELGLQTIHEETAKFIRRGYTLDVYDSAVENLKKTGAHIITHMILGLPGEDSEMMQQTAKHIASIGSDGVKLQLLHILCGTDLGDLYEAGSISALSKSEYISCLCDCVRCFPNGTVLHRITGDAPKNLLIAPKWSADKKHVLQEIRETFAACDIILQ
ncbi:MAG: TIGR01212 family radical SAM protein [Ruminococcaceae bacterium]|nr:TIGR01212 family radical SAM protein [Oscillospiraceae bacterium]